MSTPRSPLIETLESRRLLSVAVVLAETNRIFQVDAADVTTIFKSTRLRGLSGGDRVVGFDYRPSNNTLYGLVNGTSVDRVVTINPTNGKTATAFTLTTALSGTDFGVDFNPVADALRVTSNAGQNLRIPFATGATVVDGSLAFNANDLNAGATANVVGSAYTNSVAGTTSTVLYNVDATLDQLTIQTPPNAGTQISRGPLGVDTTNLVGFDIEGARTAGALTNDAFVSLTRSGATTDGGSRLYRLNLATGGVSDLGIIGGAADPRGVRDITMVLTSVAVTSAQRLAAAATAAPAATSASARLSTIARDGDLI